MTNTFSLAAINFDWRPILPLLIIGLGAVLVLLAGVRVDDRDSEGLGWLSLLSIAIAFAASLGLLGNQQVTFAGALVADDYTAFFYLVILFAAAIIVFASSIPETSVTWMPRTSSTRSSMAIILPSRYTTPVVGHSVAS